MLRRFTTDQRDQIRMKNPDIADTSKEFPIYSFDFPDSRVRRSFTRTSRLDNSRTGQQRFGDNLAAASAGKRELVLLENRRWSKYSQTLFPERIVRDEDLLVDPDDFENNDQRPAG